MTVRDLLSCRRLHGTLAWVMWKPRLRCTLVTFGRSATQWLKRLNAHHEGKDEVTDLDALREQLGISDAKLVRDGLVAVDTFFRETLRQDPLKWISYLRGIDFHKPVQTSWLPRGTRLVRYESTGERTFKPFAYFTKRGVSPYSLGTSFPSTEFKEFELDRSVQTLVSTASGVKFGVKDQVSRLGGGVQYMIAFADSPALVRVGREK